ncbi:MAG: YcaQ family DNA glycosylase [Actinobacteria bacterium]|nr:YcaQ family DNA glycosylase [Actinomycetota bacterium]
MVHLLSRRDARRIAIRAQLLDASRPTSLLGLVRHLGVLQVDGTAAVAPSADLVCWSRMGSSYRPADLDALLADRSLVEFRNVIRPAEDIAWFRAEMQDWPGREPLRDWQAGQIAWVKANDACREEILQWLRSEGPLPARELPDNCAVPWRSTGWSNHRNVLKLLEIMEQLGEVAVSGRDGRERLWDLADRVYPEVPVMPAETAEVERNERRLTSLGIARATGPACPAEKQDVGDAGEPAVIDGVRGMWRVDPAQLGQPFRGRAALLSPLDRLVADRKRMAEIFEFDYALEMYKPAAQRRWGYYALPILYGDRLIGKLDAEADRRANVLRINAIHQDVEFTTAMTSAVDREIRGLADWLQLHLEVTE